MVVNLLIMCSLVISLLPIFAEPVQAAEDGPDQLVEVTDVKHVDFTITRDNGVDAIKSAAVNAEGSGQEKSNYIIQLMDQPVTLYEGEIAGLKATSPRVTGAQSLDMTSQDVQAYSAYLATARQNFVRKVEQTLGRSVNVPYEYYATLNGLPIELTAQEAVKIAGLPNVRFIEEEQISYPQTFAGPQWISACRSNMEWTCGHSRHAG